MRWINPECGSLLPLGVWPEERRQAAALRIAARVALLVTALYLFAGASVVVLPFDDFSGDEAAARELTQIVARRIEAKGWKVVDAGAFLEAERVRYLDSLEEPVRRKLLESSGATAVVTGTLYTYTTTRNPIVALSARMVRADGTLAWGDAAGLSSKETEQLCGFGRKTTTAGVANEVASALMRRFPNPNDEIHLVRGQRKPWFAGAPLAFRSSDLDPSTPHRICVLPFDNQSSSPEAARVVTDLLSVRFAAANGFEVVEAAALRAAALKTSIASFRNAATQSLARLAPAVGTPLFLRGTIYSYGNDRIELELTLVDVDSGRVLWSAQHDRRAADYTGLLMRGAASNAVSLADRAVAELIATATTTSTQKRGDHHDRSHQARRKPGPVLVGAARSAGEEGGQHPPGQR
jgi:TolB-like protein